MAKKRQIVQVVGVGKDANTILALADDGTLWRRNLVAGLENWIEINTANVNTSNSKYRKSPDPDTGGAP